MVAANVKQAAVSVPLNPATKKADRIVAAEVLGLIGPDAAAAVPSLMNLLEDRSTVECYVAATALGRIGPAGKEAVPPLIELSERCVTDIARAASSSVETTRGVKAAVASFPVCASE